MSSSLLTRLLHPTLWPALADFAPTAIVVLLLRNLFLVGMLIPLAWPAREERASPAVVPPRPHTATERFAA